MSSASLCPRTVAALSTAALSSSGKYTVVFFTPYNLLYVASPASSHARKVLFAAIY